MSASSATGMSEAGSLACCPRVRQRARRSHAVSVWLRGLVVSRPRELLAYEHGLHRGPCRGVHMAARGIGAGCSGTRDGVKKGYRRATRDDRVPRWACPSRESPLACLLLHVQGRSLRLIGQITVASQLWSIHPSNDMGLHSSQGGCYNTRAAPGSSVCQEARDGLIYSTHRLLPVLCCWALACGAAQNLTSKLAQFLAMSG